MDTTCESQLSSQKVSANLHGALKSKRYVDLCGQAFRFVRPCSGMPAARFAVGGCSVFKSRCPGILPTCPCCVKDGLQTTASGARNGSGEPVGSLYLGCLRALAAFVCTVSFGEVDFGAQFCWYCSPKNRAKAGYMGDFIVYFPACLIQVGWPVVRYKGGFCMD